ncbi:hypothetical protein R8Z50_25560 [Longispora sp. K20-0274]
MPTTKVTVPSGLIALLDTVAEPAVQVDSPAERGWSPKDNGPIAR